MNSVTVYAPATVANIVCGFDVLGMALAEPCDKLVMRLIPGKTIRIINKDEYNLPIEPAKNVFGGALMAMLNEVTEPIGFEIESTKTIMPGSGIGSSAASAAGVVVGANHLLGNRFSKPDLVRIAMSGEQIASGSRHADNIAPCIYGGVTLIRSNNPLDIIPLNAPPLYVTAIHPQIEVKTSDARQILKKQILLKDAITQWANIAGLVAGFMKGDYDLISRSLEDILIEPVRSILIPGFAEMKARSLEAGALGGGISGSGPSVFMLSKNEPTARAVETAMHSIYQKIGVDFHIYVTTLNNQGVKVE
ncbi:MAG TPA: homoserine kinase [Chitinophagales bacterium]|nr:homoserine kinase [Chitinophagales bacterium]